ncbi:phosphotransferase family protein [Rhodococcus globerulus]|uniref:phosphotransferase family protein n=1 Tax=Rhodococcus globerulus TaxID=33008 RepID=UPI001F1F4A22|nr:phosphotransferase family protein [Rhodococcus globerulus]MCE4267558.1 phosphotransferase family protein [Rhodococcus globerulus]
MDHSAAVAADFGLDVVGLRVHIAQQIPEVGELHATLIAGGRSNPTYQVTDGDNQWILRRPPHGLVLESAHSMQREYRVIQALAGTTVPVPRVVLTCEDPSVIGASFYLMEQLDGRTIQNREQTEELSEAERHRLTEAVLSTMVALHKVDPADVGLEEFGRADGFLERQLRRWRTQWNAAHTVDRPEVDALITELAQSMPTQSRAGLVHGDFKIDNLMVGHSDPGQVVGLLDWEMSTLGDPLTDLGLLLSYWDEEGQPFHPLSAGMTALPGFGSRAELAIRYAESVGLDDMDVIDWYVSLADLKLAVIFEQIHVRHLQGQTVGEGHSGMGEMVEPLLVRALHRVRRS